MQNSISEANRWQLGKDLELKRQIQEKVLEVSARKIRTMTTKKTVLVQYRNNTRVRSPLPSSSINMIQQ